MTYSERIYEEAAKKQTITGRRSGSYRLSKDGLTIESNTHGPWGHWASAKELLHPVQVVAVLNGAGLMEYRALAPVQEVDANV